MNLFIANVVEMSHKSVDVNGNFPILLVPVAGTIPNKRAMAGTVAASMKVEAGETYLMSYTQTEDDATYGTQVSYQRISKLGALEIIKTAKELGPAREIELKPFKAEATTVESTEEEAKETELF